MEFARDCKILFTKEQIEKRICEVAKRITEDYRGEPVIFVGVLNGVYAFFSDLVRNVELPCEIDFVRASSYSGTNSTGVVNMSLDMKNSVEGKHVVIVEDILDTGRTLKAIKQELLSKNPLSVKTAVMLDKPKRRVNDFTAEYSCFEIDDLFVVGYGLDCDEKFRNLPYVAIYSE